MKSTDTTKYTVRFWRRSVITGYWAQATETVSCAGDAAHSDAAKQIRAKYGEKDVQIIRVECE